MIEKADKAHAVAALSRKKGMAATKKGYSVNDIAEDNYEETDRSKNRKQWDIQNAVKKETGNDQGIAAKSMRDQTGKNIACPVPHFAQKAAMRQPCLHGLTYGGSRALQRSGFDDKIYKVKDLRNRTSKILRLKKGNIDFIKYFAIICLYGS